MTDVATLEERSDVDEHPAESPVGEKPPRRRRPAAPPWSDRRRFVVAASTGVVAVLPLMLWALWDLWYGTINTLRGVPYDDFYDLQARAIFHGHLYLPPGRMGIEAFVHNGHDFTYFGVFPSLIRMPVLLFTSSLDGRLTAPSMFLAWALTALVSALLLWRVRILVRGAAPLGRLEAVSYGVLMSSFMGGSVLLFLAATPYVANEDFAWSVTLTISTLFAILGVLEKPTRWRAAAVVLLVIATNLNRTPTGYATALTAFLAALWFALGRGGPDRRRWARPMVVAGVLGLLVNVLVTYLKFGIPVGLPMADQVWAAVNAHRRYFLAANGGKAFSVTFIPSSLWAYLQPFGLRLSTVFPFVQPPSGPASWVGGVVLDQTYPTASMTSISPLLVGLTIWGTITAFRPKGPDGARRLRIILIGGALGSAGILVWGYIAQRYMSDLMPFIIPASCLAAVDIWRRLGNRSRQARRWTLGIITVIAAYGIAANLAITAFPVGAWTQTQVVNFVKAQQRFSLTPLGNSVETASALPNWGAAGELLAVNHCSGLYLADGEALASIPGEQIAHFNWHPVEQSAAFTHTIGVTFNRPEEDLRGPITLMTYGSSRLVLRPDAPGHFRLALLDSGTQIGWPNGVSWSVPVSPVGTQYQIAVTTDPNLQSMYVSAYGILLLNHYVRGTGPAVVTTTATSASTSVPTVSVASVTSVPPSSSMTICHSLVGNR